MDVGGWPLLCCRAAHDSAVSSDQGVVLYYCNSATVAMWQWQRSMSRSVCPNLSDTITADTFTAVFLPALSWPALLLLLKATFVNF